jgi:SH3-like domain-containing protein
MRKLVRIKILLLLVFFTNQIYAAEIGVVTGYKIPRFVSLKSNEVNLRVGPSFNYPIKIKYIQKNLPVEIVDEYDVWRKIHDIDGNLGWIHKSLLQGDRYGLIISSFNNVALIFNYPKGNQIGKIGNKNIVEINKCLEKWCLIKIKDKKGWIKKNNLWGVYKSEIYKISFIQPIINLYWDLISKKL